MTGMQPAEDVQFRGVTAKDIEAAFIELLLAGKNPTIENIRLHLGRGSPNTITKHRAAFLERVATSRSIPLPAPIPESAAGLMAQMWGLISTEAYAKYSSEVEAAQDKAAKAEEACIQTVQAIKEDAQKRLEAVASQLQQAEQHIKALQDESGRKDLRIGHLTGQLESAERDYQAAQTKCDEERAQHNQECMQIKIQAQETLDALNHQHQQKLQEEVERRAEIVASYTSMLKRESDLALALEAQLKVANTRYDADTARLMQQVDALTQELKAERKSLKAAYEKSAQDEKERKAEAEAHRQQQALNTQEQVRLEGLVKQQAMEAILFLRKLTEQGVKADIISEQLNTLQGFSAAQMHVKAEPLLQDALKKIEHYLKK